MGVGQRGPPVGSATGCPQPNQALEPTAPNAGFVALHGVVAWGPPLTAGVRLLYMGVHRMGLPRQNASVNVLQVSDPRVADRVRAGSVRVALFPPMYTKDPAIGEGGDGHGPHSRACSTTRD